MTERCSRLDGARLANRIGMSRCYDAVVVGAGPNGLAAAIVLARAGRSVLVIERADSVGGGARTAELTLPGFRHDVCSAVHPMAAVSPFFRGLELERHGLRWKHPDVPLAHPLEDGCAAILRRSVGETAQALQQDGRAWTDMVSPFVRRSDQFFGDALKPARIPSHPLLMARFAAVALRSCASVARHRFSARQARALLSGCAAHASLPLDAPASAAIGVVLAIAGHAAGWPSPEGGAQRIADALANCLAAAGGEIELGREVRTLHDLPRSRVVLLDLAPRLMDRIAGPALPRRYRWQLRSFRRGPGVFKIDWALSGAIPWRAASTSAATTVHVGGSFEEIAASERETAAGRLAEHPFVILAQPSIADPSRAPAGCQTGWAYCHVPNGCDADMTERIERQVERFAPGFRDLVIGRHTMSPAQLEARNPNLVGGDIGGGANDIAQFVFRPTWRWDPYSTPNPRLFVCSSSTPPGGGVHGMCGFWAARSALRKALH